MKLSVCLLLAASLVLTWPLVASAQATPAAPAQPEAAAQNKKTADQPVSPKKRAAAAKRRRTVATRNQDVATPHTQAPATASVAPRPALVPAAAAGREPAAVPAPVMTTAAAGDVLSATPAPAEAGIDNQDSVSTANPAPAVNAPTQPAASATAPVGFFAPIPVSGPAAGSTPSNVLSNSPAQAASVNAPQSSGVAAAPAVASAIAPLADSAQRAITAQSATSAVQRSVVNRRKHLASDNSPAASAQPQYSTGQAARLVIGQPRFSSQRGQDVVTTGTSPNQITTVTYETLQTLVGSAQGLDYANGTLIVADANRQGGTPDNNRVLIYNNIQSWLPGPHDAVLQNGTPCPDCFGAGSTTPPPTSGSAWPGASLVLGQPDFVSNNPNQQATIVYPPPAITATQMSNPIGVSYNGQMLAVADSANNRVLVWKSLPTANDQGADWVVGQSDFTTYTPGKYGQYGYPVGHCSATALRSPTAVFLDANNGLWVADTGNDRVLYYGPITGNGQAATLVLGQSDFINDIQSQYLPKTTASSLLAPASVSSDGTRLFIADSFENRVLIWNTIPSSNNQAADVVLGQKDFVSNLSNTYSLTSDAAGTTIENSVLCATNGNDTTSETGKSFPLYPPMCAATLSGPMAVISDGTRLYVADAGNDRVLVWNTIPDANTVPADVILGQPNDQVDLSSDSSYPQLVSGTDTFKTPNALAWDGTNLYVADTFNRRISVFTPGDFTLPLNAILSAASAHTYARATITVGGTVQANAVATVTIGNSNVLDSTGTEITVNYNYTLVSSDTLATVVTALVNAINSSNSGAGDPYVYATPDTAADLVILTARTAYADTAGNNITLATSLNPTTATLTLTTSGANLTGGSDASLLAPYELVRITGAPGTNGASGQILVPGIDPNNPPPVQPLNQPLPTTLDGVEFYVDGIRCPIIAVASTYVVAQLPIELSSALEPDTTPPSPSSTINVTDTLRFPRTGSGILRVQNPDGTVDVSTAVAIPVIQQSPTLFYDPTQAPNPGLAYHYSSSATATISVDGTITAGDIATVTIRDRPYNYTVLATDTTATVRDQLIAIIDAHDPEVRAFPAGAFQRIRLQAIVPGPAGNSIPINASAQTGATIIMTAFNSTLCCANVAGAPVTLDNPALPGETISVYGTGLGILTAGDQQLMLNGQPFAGSSYNNVTFDGFVASLVGGLTANVLFSGLKPGYVGLYELDLELNTSLPTDPQTTMTISQIYQVSNIVTIPVVNPSPKN
jgi:uncharacterized protein (TIGR03437 family)